MTYAAVVVLDVVLVDDELRHELVRVKWIVSDRLLEVIEHEHHLIGIHLQIDQDFAVA